MRSAFALLPAILLTGCIAIDLGFSDRYHSDFHYSYDFQPGGHIDLSNVNGSVEIRGWGENEAPNKIEITGTKNASTQEGLEEIKIEIHNTPSSIDIRTVRPSGFHNGGARYAIRVPRSAVLDRIATTNGQLHVYDLDSGGYLKSSNGSVRAENLKGGVDVQTSNSSIELHSIGGDAKMKTSNGRIHAEDVAGEVEAKTSNGSITIELDHAPKNRVRAETSNGGITVRLPATTGARLLADTTNGSVTTDFNVSENGRASHLEATINGGGPLIELTTRNGSIGIQRR